MPAPHRYLKLMHSGTEDGASRLDRDKSLALVEGRGV